MGASEYSAALWHVRAESWAAYILGSRCHYIDAPLLNGSTALILPATFKEPICAGVRAIGEVARRISRSYGPLVPEGGGRVGVGVGGGVGGGEGRPKCILQRRRRFGVFKYGRPRPPQ